MGTNSKSKSVHKHESLRRCEYCGEIFNIDQLQVIKTVYACDSCVAEVDLQGKLYGHK